mmetsp:Transcript_1066/g.2389  ORF Transcript_1066/g.2389 Transcript_1066/m.2389 type:complete len:876 (-) Transcript_1066:194-2821(-)
MDISQLQDLAAQHRRRRSEREILRKKAGKAGGGDWYGSTTRHEGKSVQVGPKTNATRFSFAFMVFSSMMLLGMIGMGPFLYGTKAPAPIGSGGGARPFWPMPPVTTPKGSPDGPLSDSDPVEDLKFYSFSRVGTAYPVQHLWGNIKTPYPTHEFYQNLVLGKGVDPENVITVLPYIIAVKGNMVSAIEPFTTASPAQVQQIFDAVVGPVSLSGKGMGYQRLIRGDKLSVTVGWVNGPGSTMQTTLVQGSPYISMEYSNAAPILESPQVVTKLVLDGSEVKLPCNGTTFTASQMDIHLLQHDALWKAYAFPAWTFSCKQGGSLNLVSAQESYNGVLRIALANNCTTGTGQHCPEHAKNKGMEPPPGWPDLLDSYANQQVVGGQVSHDVDPYSQTASISLMYQTQSLDPMGAAGGEALMMILPHHRDGLAPELLNKLNKATCARIPVGTMTPITTQTLILNLPLPKFSWESPTPVAARYLDDVRAAVEEDASKFKMPKNYQMGAGDPYNAGKLLSRMGRIVLIADELGMKEQRDSMLMPLANYTSLWLLGKTLNRLVYDKSWGGIVSCGCMYNDCGGKCAPKCDNEGPPVCPSLAEGSFAAGMDFGNGYYNDHHFHYGYILYAAAVVAKFLPKWGEQFKDLMLLLVRDVANPSPDDPNFPQYRHMDFYVGHSWAGGIFQPFLNGRNQESVSEATNCWYAVSLLGDALGDDRIKNIGLALLSMEVHAAHHYWQLRRHDSDTLPDSFTKNGVSGILWSNLIQYQTWFGSTTWELNGIQMLPFTPISEYLLDPKWVGQQIGDFSTSCTGQCVTDGWISLVCMAQAVVDVPGAWKCAKKLDNSVYSPYTAEGNGNSKSNLLYWIATRPVDQPPSSSVFRNN